MRMLCLGMLLAGSVAFAEEPKAIMQDFETAKASRVPEGWTIAKTGVSDGSAWSVTEDKTSPKGANVLAQTAKSPGPLFNLCVVKDSRFQDVEVSVSFKAVEGQTDQGGGVVWRYADADNYYVARFNPLEDNYRLYKIFNGKRTQLATKEDLVAPAGKWHTLTVQMTGNAIVCSLNGKKHLEAKDDTFAKAGKVGLWTKADARTYFDDFQAKPTK